MIAPSLKPISETTEESLEDGSFHSWQAVLMDVFYLKCRKNLLCPNTTQIPHKSMTHIFNQRPKHSSIFLEFLSRTYKRSIKRSLEGTEETLLDLLEILPV